jgi:hypothetical protein
MAALKRQDVEHLQRDIVIWVIKLRDKINEKQQEELLAKAQAFAATLGPLTATDADLEPGGLQWPAQKRARRTEFLSLIHKIQSGPIGRKSSKGSKGAAVPLAPESVVSGRLMPAATATVALNKEENYQDPSLPFFVDQEVIGPAKDFADAWKKYTKKTSDKKLRNTAATKFSMLGGALFDAVYGERDDEAASAEEEGEQGPERPRPLIRAALVHPKLKKGQKDAFEKIEAKQLESLLNAVNAETKMYNTIEDSFAQLEYDAEAECEKTCRKYADKFLPDVPVDCKACVNWWNRKEQVADAEKELATAEKSGNAKKIKKMEKEVAEAQESLSEAAHEVYATKVLPIKDKFTQAMARRLRQLFLGSESALAELETAEEQELAAEEKEVKDIFEAKFRQQTAEERDADAAEKIAKEGAYMRARFAKMGEEKHPDWTPDQLAAAVDRVMAARQGLKKNTKAADNEFKDAEAMLMGKGKYKTAKPPTFKPAAKKKAAPEDEEDEDDEEYHPDVESDEDEEDGDDGEDDADEKSGGGGQKRRQPSSRILKAPKSYSGTGTFVQPTPSPYSRMATATATAMPSPLPPPTHYRKKQQQRKQQIVQEDTDAQLLPRPRKIPVAISSRPNIPGMFRPSLPRLSPMRLLSQATPTTYRTHATPATQASHAAHASHANAMRLSQATYAPQAPQAPQASHANAEAFGFRRFGGGGGSGGGGAGCWVGGVRGARRVGNLAPHRAFYRSSRTAGGCGCDPLSQPRDDDTPL